MNSEKLISSFNKLNHLSFDESKSYFLHSNNKQNTKKNLYSGFYKKKNYLYKKNWAIKEDKYQKKQIKEQIKEKKNFWIK